MCPIGLKRCRPLAEKLVLRVAERQPGRVDGVEFSDPVRPFAPAFP